MIVAVGAAFLLSYFYPFGLGPPSQPPDRRNDHRGDKPYSEQGRPDRQPHQAEKSEHHRHEDRTRDIDVHELARLDPRDRNVGAEHDRGRGGEPH